MKPLVALPVCVVAAPLLVQLSGPPPGAVGPLPGVQPRLSPRSVVLPTWDLATLPPPGTPGSLARLSDGERGVWMDAGTSWVPLAAGATNVLEHGARGDGVTDDTAAIQAALDSGASRIVFPPATYAVGMLDVPSGVELRGRGATLVATGAPLEVLRVDAGASPREHVLIEGFTFQGSASYLVHLVGPVRMTTLRDLRVTTGGGSAIVRAFNDSPALNASGVRIEGIDARVGGWDHAVRIERGGLARAAGVAFDDFDVVDVSHWAAKDVVYVDAPLLQSRIAAIYGGLFASQGQSVVRVETDAGYGLHLEIEDVYMETWTSSSVAVRLRGLEYVTVEGAEANRIASGLFGVRAVRAEDVRLAEIRAPMIRDTGQSPASTPAGYYPAVELTDDTRDNLVRFPDRNLVGNRVLDAGLRNRVEGDRNDGVLEADHARSTAMGSTAEVVLKTATIPGGTLGPRDGLHLVAAGTVQGGTGTSQVRLRWGGAPVSGSTIAFAPGVTGAWRADVWIWNDGAGGQRISILTHGPGGLFGHGFVNAAVDTSGEAVLAVTGEPGEATDAVHADLFRVEEARETRVD